MKSGKFLVTKFSVLEPQIKGDSRRGVIDLHRNGVIFFFMYVSDNHELS